LIIVVLLIGLICVFLPQYAKYREMQQKELHLKREMVAQEAALKQYQQLQAKFPSDPRFVERMAREAGMVRTNEAVCRLATNAAQADVVVSNRIPPGAQPRPQPVSSAARTQPPRTRQNTVR
jgi:hypothetical protein